MATISTAYAAEATITIAPASLASSADWTAGVESDAISNAVNLYLDALVSGTIMTGTTPTVSTQINIYVYAQYNDTPTYPDVLDGTSSAETFTSANVQNGAVALGASITVDATSNRAYYVKPFSIAQLFGGVLPKRWGLFISHNTGVALNATAGNHEFKFLGITGTVV